MPTSHAGRNARSRAELVCPSCHTEGLDRFDAFADRHDDPRQKLIHGTRCPNCDQRVPPDKVEQQLAPPEWSLAGLSITIPNIIQNPPIRAFAIVTGVLLFLLAFFIIPTMIGPILGGGSAQTDAPRGGTAVYSDGGWTIYETSNGNYYIYNGNQYLTPTGPSDGAYYYRTEDVARDILESFLQYDSPNSFQFSPANNSTDGLPGWSPENNTSTGTGDGTNWTYNGTNGGSGSNPPGYENPNSGDGGTGPEYQDPNSGDGGTGPGYENPNDGGSFPDDGYTAPTDKEPLHGHVRDSQGQPIEDATVTISGTETSITTGSAGDYALIDHLSTGTYDVTVRRDGLVTRPITIEKSYNGDITVQGSPDHAVYVEGDSGAVAQNKLSIVMPDSGAANPIRLTGTGSDMTGTVRFQNPANAESATLTLTGITSSERKQTVASINQPAIFQIDGNTAPNTTLTLDGSVVSEDITMTGATSSTATVTLDGNLPTSPVVTLEPNPETSQGRTEVSVDATDWATPATISNEGNVETPVEVTVDGKEWRQTERITGVLDGSRDVSVDGFRQPSGESTGDPVLQLTGQSSISESLASGREHNSPRFNHDKYVQQTDVFTPEEPGLYRVAYSLEANYYSHVHSAWGDSTFPEFGRAQVRFNGESLDSVYAKCPKYTGCSDTDRNSSTTTVQVTEEMVANDATFVAQATGHSKRADGDSDYHSSGTAEIESIKRVTKTGEVTIKQDGQHVETTKSLDGGEATAVRLSDLGPSTSTLTLATSGDEPVSYELAWTEHHRTSGVTITQGGESVASIDEGFTGTETVTIPERAVPPGETTVTVKGQRRADRFDATLEWTSRTVTKSPSIQTKSGKTLFEGSGKFASAKEVTVDEPLSAGTTLEIESGGGTLDYEVAYPARVAAESATVSVNGETYEYPSAFDANGGLMAPVEVNSSALTLGGNELRVEAQPVDGIQPDVSVTAAYNGSRVVTNQPSVTIMDANGESQTVEIPDSQLRNGRLYGNASVNLPADAFTAGENTVRVRTADGSVVRALVTARGIHNQTKEFEEEGV